MTLPTPRILASIAFGICALLTAGFWMIYLFIGNPPTVTAKEQILFALDSSNPASQPMRWLGVFLVVSLCLSLGYASPISRTKAGAQLLLVFGTAQCSSAVLTLAIPESLIFAVPLVWAFATYSQT